ncbi:hypothetical protein SDC9_169918 [bioreactor metagenome]|uniref:Uncharacterized protein n=1 Tax=bioreactor metagenome TaxID=1076179 RepID=A0A645G7B3_9ZZZZ
MGLGMDIYAVGWPQVQLQLQDSPKLQDQPVELRAGGCTAQLVESHDHLLTGSNGISNRQLDQPSGSGVTLSNPEIVEPQRSSEGVRAYGLDA